MPRGTEGPHAILWDAPVSVECPDCGTRVTLGLAFPTDRSSMVLLGKCPTCASMGDNRSLRDEVKLTKAEFLRIDFRRNSIALMRVVR